MLAVFTLGIFCLLNFTQKILNVKRYERHSQRVLQVRPRGRPRSGRVRRIRDPGHHLQYHRKGPHVHLQVIIFPDVNMSFFIFIVLICGKILNTIFKSLVLGNILNYLINYWNVFE